MVIEGVQGQRGLIIRARLERVAGGQIQVAEIVAGFGIGIGFGGMCELLAAPAVLPCSRRKCPY